MHFNTAYIGIHLSINITAQLCSTYQLIYLYFQSSCSNSPVKHATEQSKQLPKSKIPHKSSRISRPLQKQKIVHVQQNVQSQHVITSERLPQSTSGVVSNIIDGPPHRAVSFHERATSKDVIDELNRMIRNGEESGNGAVENTEVVGAKLDEACRPTGWVHVEKDIDLTDPKVSKMYQK